MREESEQDSRGVALGSRLGQAYGEESFLYFLAAERKRSERSGRPFLLLLVDVKDQPDVSVRIDPTLGAKIFSRLRLCLRETDFVGWYREERVAAAVLTQLEAGSLAEGCSEIDQRVNAMLREGLPPHLARNLRVHIYQLGPRVKG
jgi:hypothetical protein